MVSTKATHGRTIDPLVLVCSANDRFAMPLAVTVRSALDSLRPGRRLLLFVLDGGITPENRARAEASWDRGRVEVRWLDPPLERLERLGIRDSVHLPAYFRLLIPDLLPQELTRAIYLDSDVLVLRDLERLWRTPLRGRPVGAVQDMVIQTMGNAFGPRDDLGVPLATPYFNSGVLLMDLRAWRTKGIGERTIRYLDRNRDWVRFLEQDALNVVLRGNWTELDLLWNVLIQGPEDTLPMVGLYPRRLFEAMAVRPYIIHFVGLGKPWLPESTHPRSDLYFACLDRTAWAGWRPQPPVRRAPAVRPSPPRRS